MQPNPIDSARLTLSELLDRALNKGVVLWGDATISVAGVDLSYVGLKVLLASVDTAQRLRPEPALTSPARSRPISSSPPLPLRQAGAENAVRADAAIVRREKITRAPDNPAVFERPTGALAARCDTQDHIAIDPERIERDLARLVLGVIELLRQLIERQAVRRVENGALSGEEIERLGQALLRLETRMDELKAAFGLVGQDLTLDLGPLRDLAAGAD